MDSSIHMGNEYSTGMSYPLPGIANPDNLTNANGLDGLEARDDMVEAEDQSMDVIDGLDREEELGERIRDGKWEMRCEWCQQWIKLGCVRPSPAALISHRNRFRCVSITPSNIHDSLSYHSRAPASASRQDTRPMQHTPLNPQLPRSPGIYSPISPIIYSAGSSSAS